MLKTTLLIVLKTCGKKELDEAKELGYFPESGC